MKSEKIFEILYGKAVRRVTGKPVARNERCPSCKALLLPTPETMAAEGSLYRDDANKRNFYLCPCGQSFIIPWGEGWFYAIPSFKEALGEKS